MTHNAESEARAKALAAMENFYVLDGRVVRFHVDAAIDAYPSSLPGDDVVTYIQRRQEITVAFIANEEISYEDAFRVAHADRATLLAHDAAHTAKIAELELHIKTHAGDTISLDNEIRDCREEIDELSSYLKADAASHKTELEALRERAAKVADLIKRKWERCAVDHQRNGDLPAMDRCGARVRVAASMAFAIRALPLKEVG